jgi:hypothetical protein
MSVALNIVPIIGQQCRQHWRRRPQRLPATDTANTGGKPATGITGTSGKPATGINNTNCNSGKI